MLVDVADTRLHVEERGAGDLALVALHGGPGLDHTMFGTWLDPEDDEYRLLLVDERAQGRSVAAPRETWTLAQHARDVDALATALGLERYVVLGHSFGAFIALQHAVDFAGRPTGTIVSSGLPSERFLDRVEQHLAAFEPVELREQVTSSWEREKSVRTQEEVAELLHAQWPFQFADPHDPRIEEYEKRTAGSIYSTDVLRRFASEEYGGIEVEDRLHDVTQPVLVLAGRHDRTCSVEASQAIAAGAPRGELVVFESSGHMTFVEENDAYVRTVRDFLKRHIRSSS